MNLPKVYEPAEYESDIYALWEKTEAFKPRGTGESFSIVVPPPNANGNLHIGHALTLAVEDIAIRYNRLKGRPTLFVPGADHAGFETQVVYERQLAKEGKSRFDFSREDLYSQIWDFVAQNKENYESQFRKLGASVDWNSYVFTLDDKIIKRAYATFKKMWDEGLIYRGERLVNFCTFHGTAFADIEVSYKEETSKLWYIRYPLTDGTGEIIVATTRPETMLGDTAVAVHPEDARYHAFLGKTLTLPITGREIPIIADDFVDREFGTGAVKITPAHDQNDFDAGERHALPKITVINDLGNIDDGMPAPYRGLKAVEARKLVVKELEEQGWLLKTEDLTHSVGHCYKCDTVIEPLLREQWFVNMKPLASKAVDAINSDSITFYPKAKQKQLVNYLENLRDWNISRQIAWGIPIPAYQNLDEPDDWIFSEDVSQEFIEQEGKRYKRDPDVFDTWFSSSSWPYATLDYPDGDKYKQFYPLNVMETGYDILMPWVSRMIMLGLYVTGEVPFKSVYLHGLVLDEHGQKMSKSKGNVVNPLDIADKYGSDALRIGLIIGQSAGSNQPFSEAKIIGARNFCNKLWNIARYIEATVTVGEVHTQEPKPQTADDHWIVQKLQRLTEVYDVHLDHYRFSEAYEALYHFVWDDFADWYLEASKTVPNEPLLAWMLQSILQLTHPFAPFLTETIWQTLKFSEDQTLAADSLPKVPDFDEFAAAKFETLRDIIIEARAVQRALDVSKPTLAFEKSELVSNNTAVIQRMARLKSVEQREKPTGEGIALTNTSESCWMDVSKEVISQYTADLTAKLHEHEALIAQLDGRLSNKAYIEKAPAHLIEETKAKKEEVELLQKNVLDALGLCTKTNNF